MESTMKVDQDALLDKLGKAEKTEAFDLQDGRQVLVYQGKVIDTALWPTRRLLACIYVESLASLVQLVQEEVAQEMVVEDESGKEKASIPCRYLLRVNSPDEVAFIDVTESERHQQIGCAKATLPKVELIGNYVSLEATLISLRENFEQTDLVQEMIDELSSMKIEDLAELKDDGRSMAVTFNAKIVSEGRQATATVKQLSLSPLRTFPEEGIEIVPNDFLMRWKRNGNNIQVMLAESLHHRWRLEQMRVVQKYLQEALPEVPVLV